MSFPWTCTASAQFTTVDIQGKTSNVYVANVLVTINGAQRNRIITFDGSKISIDGKQIGNPPPELVALGASLVACATSKQAAENSSAVQSILVTP